VDLKSLMVDIKQTSMDYPGFEGFKVNIAHISREKLVALRKGCIESKFDRKTRVAYEELNDVKFLEKFTEATVKGWTGLKLEYLEQLMLVDIESQDPNAELPYTPENAVLLVRNSTAFDGWLNEVVNDLDNFRSGRNRDTVGEAE